ncbi:MAG: cupredoxin domain-containing protein [Dehalococcoidia bacterium]
MFQNISFKLISFGLCLILSIAMITACGGSDSSSNVVDPNEIRITSGIDGEEFSFDPETINVNVSETVKLVFENNGTIAHDFEIPDLEVVIQTTNSGNSGEITFVAPSIAGSYDFICSIPGHKEAGMVGKLVVN